MSSAQETHAQIKPSPISGEGLFATKDIVEGELIARVARPLFAALSIGGEAVSCGHCFRTPDPLDVPNSIKEVFNCQGCHRIKYCSKECQSRSWKRIHKFECKIYRVKEWPPLPSQVRLALQVALMKNNGTLTEEEVAGVNRMAISETGSAGSLLTEKQAVHDLVRLDWKCHNMTYQDIESLFDLITANTLTIVLPLLHDVGLALDPFISKANHSCQPNAIVMFDGCKACIRSIKPIAKGEEIVQSYIDITFHRSIRRSTIQDIFGFDCACAKCTSNDPFDSEPLPSLIKDLYEANSRAHMTDSTDTAMRISKAIIRIGQENKVPLTRQPIPDAYWVVMGCSLQAQDWRTALIVLVKTYFLIDPVLYPEQFFVTRVAHTWMLLKVIRHWCAHYESLDDPLGWEREWGIDNVLVVIRRITKNLKVDALKSHGPSLFYNWVTKSATEIDELLDQVDPLYRRYIESDRGDEVWMQFERLKHNKIDLSDAAESIYEDSR